MTTTTTTSPDYMRSNAKVKSACGRRRKVQASVPTPRQLPGISALLRTVERAICQLEEEATNEEGRITRISTKGCEASHEKIDQ